MTTDVEKRADEGDAESQCSLAFLYEIGIDREQNLDLALEWWKKAAAQGHAIALKKVAHYEGGTDASDLPDPSSQNSHQTTDVLPKVLLLEDELELREMVEMELENCGFHVIACSNGEEGLNQLIAHPDVRVIVTDLKMPRMNGMQFIKTIRRMKLAEDAGLIVMTSYSKPELIESGRKLEVDQWLAKPFDLEKLRESVIFARDKGNKKSA